MQYHTASLKPAYSLNKTHDPVDSSETSHCLPLHTYVEKALKNYFTASEGEPVKDLYRTLLSAIEPAMLKVTLDFCKTQAEAAKALGLSRVTLRKKLKQYHFKTDE